MAEHARGELAVSFYVRGGHGTVAQQPDGAWCGSRLEQLGAGGKPTMGRVITDTQLKLWEFDAKRVFRNARPDESWEWEPAVTSPPTP